MEKVGTIERQKLEEGEIISQRRLILPDDMMNIIEDSNSYQEDIQLLAEWFKMGKRSLMFETILKEVIRMEKISWRNIEKCLEAQKIKFTATDQTAIGIKITQELKKTKNRTTAIMFFRILKNLQKSN